MVNSDTAATGLVPSSNGPLKQLLLKLMSLPIQTLRSFFRFLATISGITPEQLSFPKVSKIFKLQNENLDVLAFPMKLVVATLSYLIRIGKLLFVPQVILRQVIAVFLLQSTYELSGFTWKHIICSAWNKSESGKLAESYRNKMKHAETYTQYRECNRKLGDVVENSDESVEENDQANLLPDEKKTLIRLEKKVMQYREFLQKGDVTSLQYHLRSDLLRKHFGVNHRKRVLRDAVTEYQSVICEALNTIATSDTRLTTTSIVDELRYTREKANFFKETQRSYGNSALLLSGGARMGLLHVGVVKCLHEQNLLPRVFSGSSAGSLVTSMLGTKTDEEITELFNPKNLNLKFFGRQDSLAADLDKLFVGAAEETETNADVVKVDKDKDMFESVFESRKSFLSNALVALPPPLHQIISLLLKLLPKWRKDKAILDVNVLKDAVRDVIGDITFQEAYEKTGRVINITVSARSHESDRDFPQLLNYLTTPNVVVWSAAIASCSIPGVFAPVELLHKGPTGEISPYHPEGVRFQDGSIECDLPIARLKELFNVNHFIVSQVNVHARLLAPHMKMDFYGHMPVTIMNQSDRFWGLFGTMIMFLRDQIRSYAKHVADLGIKNRMLKWLGLGLLPLFTQKYHGDITIVPDITLDDLKTLLRNPSDEEYKESIRKGERMTWPKVSEIRRRCSTEFLLLDCLKALEEQTRELEDRLLQETKRTSTRGFPQAGNDRLGQLLQIREDEVDNMTFASPLGNLGSLQANELSSHGDTFKREGVTLNKLQSKLNKRVVSVLDLSSVAQNEEE